jgi:hypothetical protein
MRGTLASLVVLLSACSSGSGGGPFIRRDMTAPPDMALPPYPAEPWGNQIGDTFPDLELAGYRLTRDKTDATQLMWDTTIRSGDYHRDPQCKCLLVTIGARWCGPCKQEQPQLVGDIAGDPDFCVLNILQEGLAKVTATQSDLDAWNAAYRQNFYIVQGTAETKKLMSGHGSTIGIPFNFIVEPSEMKVLGVVQGYRPDIHIYSMAKCEAGGP